MSQRDAETARAPTRLADYRAPAWWVDAIALRFELDFEATEVHARLAIRRNPEVSAAPLVLDGEGLELLELALDGRALAPGQYERDETSLSLAPDADQVVVETRVRIAPSRNTTLEGLYRSGEFLLTQCEAQGFRHITYFPDRPDVMARFEVTLVASPARFPVLLSNGNPAGSGTLPDGRHYTRWVDPWPKPSYLFALVAGRLLHIEDSHVTPDGRTIALRIYAEADAIARCGHAMHAIKQAMRWDEERYGRAYDLEVFNVVATNDFNMGAMENKGLNIFNAKYIVASPETATDVDFQAIEGVVGHEYFHNWTGNRITCRDWFQLSLKEGLTVFRDQEFSADLGSRAVERIEQVRGLRAQQFPEDAGPLAHPVRPDNYREINNFYTATVYEKGAEIVRMLHTVLGAEGFRRGMDRYFDLYDGRAVTCEDFVSALGEANGRDLGAFLRWYTQAGTPQLRVVEHHDAATRRHTFTLSQITPPTPGQAEKLPVPIPVRLMLYGRDGAPLPLRLEGAPEAGAVEQIVLLFDGAEQSFVLLDVAEPPVASLLQGCSAPVHLHHDADAGVLAFLARHDRDPVNRWDAMQVLAERAVLAEYGRTGAGLESDDWRAACAAGEALLADAGQDAAFAAECLTLPDEITLAERIESCDPQRLHLARESVRSDLAIRLAPALAGFHRTTAGLDAQARDGISIGKRRLRNLCLDLLVRADPEAHAALARAQLRDAGNMTDRMAALTCLVHAGAEGAQQHAEAFYQRYRNDPLLVDKWLALQASNPQPGTLQRVEDLIGHPAFTLRNPNKVRSLLGVFARQNRVAFHDVGGEGYRFIATQVLALDALNPQAAARLVSVFNGWRRFEPLRRALMRNELERIAAATPLSRDLSEIVQRALA